MSDVYMCDHGNRGPIGLEAAPKVGVQGSQPPVGKVKTF